MEKTKRFCISSVLILISIIEIFILINSIFANGYIISASFGITNGKKVNLAREILEKGGDMLIGFFTIKQIGTVSAITLNNFCCEKTNEGSVCQNVFSDTFENAKGECNGELIPTSCDNLEKCKLGCCIDSAEGTCVPRSPKELCENGGGIWDDSESCSEVSVCQKACCKLGRDYKFITENECEKRSAALGVQMSFDAGITSEAACLFLGDNNVRGACVIEDAYEGNACSMETEKACKIIGGDFYKDLLCTNPRLNTVCEKTTNTTCIEGGVNRGVYFVDSCGNLANIYDADEVDSDSYWNEMLDEGLCSISQDGVENCGNCNIFTGTICGLAKDTDINPEYGSYVCRDLNCADAPVQIDNKGNVLNSTDRRNGESWCIYDSAIGVEESPFGNNLSADTVGSLHWKASCINGKVEYELCGDARTGICTQTAITDPNVNQVFSTAGCVTNEATICLMVNQEAQEECANEKNMTGCITDYFEENCITNAQCRVDRVDLDKFEFETCVPNYPKGFNLKPSEINSEGNKLVCGLASQTCTVVYEKDILGDWQCKDNCDCASGGDNPGDAAPSEEFISRMNDLCVSLGDCGTYVNYQGVGTENLELTPSPLARDKVYGEDYSILKNTIALKSAISGISEETITKLIGIHNSGQYGAQESESFNKFLQGIQGASAALSVGGMIVEGGVGDALYSAGQGILRETFINTFASSQSLDTAYAASSFGGSTGGTAGTTLQALGTFANVIVIAAIGASVGQLIAKQLGYQGGSVIMATAGGAVLAVALYYIWQGASGFGLVGWIIAAIVSAIVIAWGAITGYGEIRTEPMTVECLPWQAPTGSQNCESCNNDPLGRPCTEYKCNSIGQTCKLVNQDTEKPECISTRDDGTAPLISTGEIVTENFGFVNKQSNQVQIESDSPNNDGSYCVNSFTPLIFTMQTDEYAQCKFSFIDTGATSFEDMQGMFPGQQNSFLLNHSFVLNFPSIDLFNLSTNQDFEESLRNLYSDMRLYVRCQDYWGNYNVAPYIIEFCVVEEDNTAVNPGGIIFNPPTNSYLPFNTTSKRISMSLPEPAECKYDIYPGQTYEDMEGDMDCSQGLFGDGNGWTCSGTLTDLFEGDNEYYFRCQDNADNINGDDIDYNLIVSDEELTIDSAEFNVISNGDVVVKDGGKKVIVGGVPIEINLDVETSGGALNGVSECYYTFNSANKNNPPTEFLETNSSSHSQLFNQMVTGNFTVYIKCKDVANNIALASKEINIQTDDNPPQIIRAYVSDDKIILLTDEDAKCSFSTSTCDFDVDDADYKISTSYTQTHETKRYGEIKYYIKCEDAQGNVNPGCAGIIRTV